MKIATHITWLTVTLAISLRGASVSADNWPQWRGPAGTGASSETRLPESWSDTGNIAWKTRLNGVGVSSHRQSP
jgi:outer membrane protein assembly factor BamB